MDTYIYIQRVYMQNRICLHKSLWKWDSEKRKSKCEASPQEMVEFIFVSKKQMKKMASASCQHESGLSSTYLD